MENPFDIIISKLEQLYTSVLGLRQNQTVMTIPPKNRIGGIDLAKEVTGKATSTVYNLCSTGKIPHYKQAGKLYFSEEELLEWIKQGKQTAINGLAKDVDKFLSNSSKESSRKKRS